jgi:hypothetical protein
MATFKEKNDTKWNWTKKNGCNCCPINENSEHYVLSVGSIYRGEVKYNGSVWGGAFFIFGKEVASASGGTYDKDHYMKFIENRISTNVKELFNVTSKTVGDRHIYDPLWHQDEDEVWYQKLLEGVK